MGLLDKVQDKVQDQLNKRNNNNANHPNTTTYDNTHSGTHGQGMVPGSHANANNPNAIPTAGGQTVGGVGYDNNSHVGGPGMNTNTGYNNAGLHQTTGDKMQNALPGQHGNAHDAHGNSVDLSGPGHNTHGSNYGSNTGHNSNAGVIGGNSAYNNNSGPGYNNNNAGLHQTTGDKMQNALPGQRGNAHDAHGNPVDLAGPGHNTHGSTTGGLAGSHNTHTTHETHGTHNTNYGTGNDNRGMMDKAKDMMSSKRSNHPDDPVTGTNYDQNTHNNRVNDPYNQTGTGITGGTAFAGSNTHDTHGVHNTHNTHDTHGAHNTHNTTHTNYGNDNRGMMDKAKDALSSKRSNHPDDPVTGTNYDQNTHNTHNSGVTGTHDPYHQTGSGLHGTNTTTHHQTGPGLTGTHNTHNTTHTNYGTGNDNRGMMDKAKDLMSSKRSNHPDDPVTGTNYDQKNTAGVHGSNAYGQQPGVHGNTGAYGAPGSGPAPNY